MRFSGSDSTSTLVALSEEIVDLVNVKHSLKDNVLEHIDWVLTEVDNFYKTFWRYISEILAGKKVEDPLLLKYGWNFEGTFRDNIYFMEKMSHNFMKFFSKFYDVQRTDIHNDFKAFKMHERILKIFF